MRKIRWHRAVVLVAGIVVGASRTTVARHDPSFAYIYTKSPHYDATAWMEGRDRFPSGARLYLAVGASRRALVPDFYASADAAVSYDARRVLFTGKRAAADRWAVWELELSGSAPRLIAECPADCMRPLYLADGRIVYSRGTDLAIAGEGPLTFAPGHYLTSDALRDGRVLYESAGELYTLYPDGTGVEALRCDHGKRRHDARQIASGDYIFHSGTRLARITSSLAAQTTVAQPHAEAAGPIAELANGEWLVSLRDGLYRWSAATGKLTSMGVEHAVQPVVVAPRHKPREFPSARVATRPAGNLLGLNAEGRKIRLYSTTGLLGEVDAASDGSFYVQVPPDRPLRIEVADAEGRTVRAERGWFWMRPGEQRVCVGCHAGPERSPENRVPEVLLKSIHPVKISEVLPR